MNRHTFDLRFVAPPESALPTIVFVTESSTALELGKYLQNAASEAATYAEKYLGRSAEFTLPTPDLFEETTFGYGRCGWQKTGANEIYWGVALSRRHRKQAALTLSLLCDCMSLPVRGRHSSERTQELMLSLSTLNEEKGHSVNGFMSGAITDWIARYATRHKPTEGSRAQLPLAVLAAMRSTWQSVMDPKHQVGIQELGGSLACDGRFQLMISPAGGCYLGIDPDQISHPGELAQFSSQNMDSAEFQLIALAGLATLYELFQADQ